MRSSVDAAGKPLLPEGKAENFTSESQVPMPKEQKLFSKPAHKVRTSLRRVCKSHSSGENKCQKFRNGMAAAHVDWYRFWTGRPCFAWRGFFFPFFSVCPRDRKKPAVKTAGFFAGSETRGFARGRPSGRRCRVRHPGPFLRVRHNRAARGPTVWSAYRPRPAPPRG